MPRERNTGNPHEYIKPSDITELNLRHLLTQRTTDLQNIQITQDSFADNATKLFWSSSTQKIHHVLLHIKQSSVPKLQRQTYPTSVQILEIQHKVIQPVYI